MGVHWIMEVLSWTAGRPEYLWYITDLGNILKGYLFSSYLCGNKRFIIPW
jgi:hypothetical protein